MRYTRTEEQLMSEMSAMPVIDCHEHLPPEEARTSVPQDVFTLFSHYTRHDLFSAGMDIEAYHNPPTEGEQRPVHASLFDYDIPLEKRWQTFRPYWESIRFGSYARAALITAQKVYGVTDINDNTYQLLSERIAEENTPGLYERILCWKCGIEAALTQCGRTGVERPLVPLMPVALLTDLRSMDQARALAEQAKLDEPRTLDAYLAAVEARLGKWIEEGAVGLKMMSGHYPRIDQRAAAVAYKKLAENSQLPGGGEECSTLRAYLVHTVADLAAELDLTVAVHAGIWGDFRAIDSKHMLEFAPAHPRTRFDLYHLGMPSVRDTIVVAKNLPNVYLNLCWTHIISQVQCRSGIDEMLDQVPVNKVLAFGGDYHRPVEKVVGHLHMAREDLAAVLGRRIDVGMMSLSDAKYLLEKWFWDNPLELYPLLHVEKPATREPAEFNDWSE